MGPARLYGLVFGITYLAVSVLEVLLAAMDRTVQAAGMTLFEYAAVHNAIHFATGLVVLLSFFMWEFRARLIARIVGFAFAAVSLLGLFARDLTGDLMGFGGPLPWSYEAIHILTAVAALLAGFLRTEEPATRARGSPAHRRAA